MRTRLALWLIVIVSFTLAGGPLMERPAFASAQAPATIGPALQDLDSPAVREAQPGPIYDVFRPHLLAPPPGAAGVVAVVSPFDIVRTEVAQPSCQPARSRALGARAPPLVA